MSRWPRVQDGSQGARILDALADGQWHSTAEIHRKAGFSRLNSRISELLKKGYTVAHRGGGAGAANHYYKLVSEPLAEVVDLAALRDAKTAASGPTHLRPESGPLDLPAHEQMGLL